MPVAYWLAWKRQLPNKNGVIGERTEKLRSESHDGHEATSRSSWRVHCYFVAISHTGFRLCFSPHRTSHLDTRYCLFAIQLYNNNCGFSLDQVLVWLLLTVLHGSQSGCGTCAVDAPLLVIGCHVTLRLGVSFVERLWPVRGNGVFGLI